MELTISEVSEEKTSNIKSILKSNNIKNNNINKEPNTKRVSYDDILAKMGMYVDNGKLHLAEKCSSPGFKEQCTKPTMQCSKVKCSRIQESLKQQSNPNPNPNPNYLQQQSLQNSYIYNKHFKKELHNTEPKILVPSTPQEYKQMLIKKILENKIQRLRVQQIKSTKLIMPTENIHIAPERTANLNRLFHFSQK
jgi:hypothetical protein